MNISAGALSLVFETIVGYFICMKIGIKGACRNYNPFYLRYWNDSHVV